MEILFKDNSYVFYIEHDILLEYNNLEFFRDEDLINVPHLKDVPPLFSAYSPENNTKHYVYYRHNGREIVRNYHDKNFHFVSFIFEDDIIDYTEYNINKILNEDII